MNRSPSLTPPRPLRYRSVYAVRVALSLCALAACDRGDSVEAPTPATLPDTIAALPGLPPSLIEAPVSYDLTPVLASLEKAVPLKFGDLEKREKHPTNSRVTLAFEAKREPFKLALDGDSVRMTAVIRYAGRVWYNPPLAPTVSASCGTSDTQPRAILEVVSPLRLSENWKLRSRTKVRQVAAFSDTEADQCEVTVLKIDVTGRVIDAARKLLESNTKVVDAQIAGIDLHSKFEEWWNVIQQPIRLTDTVWLVLNPTAVRVEPAEGSRRMLRTGIGLTAEPRIVVGRKPTIPAVPLPKQNREPTEVEGFHIMLEGVLNYDVASKLLTEELHGERIGKGRRSVVIQTVRMFGIGGGRVALEVNFAGATRGRIYFTGTPHYDLAKDQLFVPDLDYDVGTASLLVRGIAWLKHDDLRNYLRDRARWPLGGLIKEGREQLLSGLNRELAPGVHLSGDVHDVQLIGVHAAPDAVRVRAHADGSVRLDVRPSR